MRAPKFERKRFLLAYCTLVLAACAAEIVLPPPVDSARITAVAETEPVGSGDDAADDPAIWLHPRDPELSLVIGTDKQFGLESYRLDGSRRQRLAMGRTNNVDLRNLPESANWSALAAASNRTTNSISLVLIDPQGDMHWLTDSEIATGLTEPYGLCMYRDSAGLQVFVNDTDGRYQQWLLRPQLSSTMEDSMVQAQLLREFRVPSQPEGCSADDAAQRLFIGVEAEGVYWLEAAATEPATLHEIAAMDGIVLTDDVEGMDLYIDGDDGLLMVSVQGNYSYAFYDRNPPFGYRGSLVVDDGAVDGTQETDGLAVHSGLSSSSFPRGLVVVQDGFNTLPDSNQNFKLLSWADIEQALGLKGLQHGNQ